MAAAIQPHHATGIVAILGGRSHILGLNEQVLTHTMARVKNCRLLANEATDENIVRALSRIAAEGEADIELLSSLAPSLTSGDELK
jgi:hypothetical protein